MQGRPAPSIWPASLPGRYLDDFGEPEFWKALPCLATLKVMVIEGVGAVECGSASIPQYRPVPMSREGRRAVQEVPWGQIATLENIKTLEIGWTSGGEHATGLCGRNNSLFLPAPFLTNA
ncbi:f-box domain-containing protein [Diplodia corticola]|uniref:F-box domain-containing protein n=1 Tax=Diplodia corticola TaxID=236234 RepID=A0A1J9QP35_9PEZI|nr:f-box domain-containing protein [Diplodia corticola]OJD30208.1 f-box domain-containing protein [Diplodia corticola]